MKVLGLDVGEKRIGVARADSNVRIAVPIETVEVNGKELERIGQLARINSTNLFILGLPRSNEGNETAQTTFVKNFAKKLKKAIPEAKIKFQDESLTSVVAEDRLKKRKKGFEKGDIDAEAATVILQDFLESINPEKTNINEAGLANSGAYANSEKTEVEAKKQPKERALKKAENGKKKSKKLITIITSAIILIILAVSAVVAVILIKQHNAKVRAEEYARLEAEMKAEVFSFTILPGETTMDVKKKLLDKGYESSEIDMAMHPKNYKYAFLKGLDSLEGYLYGETIEFYEHSKVTEILDKFLGEMDKVITENNLEARYNAHGLSLHEGIILASIVQGEAKSPDQPTVAQVFYSRLADGWHLGSDATMTYLLDMIDPERQTYTDNASILHIESCYNTSNYGVVGLPCGAVSNPGLSALLAVAEPSDTGYYYFLTGDDGMMYYSYTAAEHDRNRYLYCQERCNIAL